MTNLEPARSTHARDSLPRHHDPSPGHPVLTAIIRTSQCSWVTGAHFDY